MYTQQFGGVRALRADRLREQVPASYIPVYIRVCIRVYTRVSTDIHGHIRFIRVYMVYMFMRKGKYGLYTRQPGVVGALR